jgi:hypothetical protein
MGIDLLDLTFRAERRTGMKLRWRAVAKEMEAMARGGKFDITVAEFCTLVRIVHTREPRCAHCGYDLRGHDEAGVCPECGAAFKAELSWEEAREIVADVAACDPSTIEPETRLIHDLCLD